MGRARRGLVPAAASGPKERHKRSQRSQYHNPYSPPRDSFVAKPPLPKSKHHSYFELVENKEKKKKLEYQVRWRHMQDTDAPHVALTERYSPCQITTEKTPPPGFEFVPIGNPQLTAACKEISREKDAMIFIVSVCLLPAVSLIESYASNLYLWLLRMQKVLMRAVLPTKCIELAIISGKSLLRKPRQALGTCLTTPVP